jgi:hypothetical protein
VCGAPFQPKQVQLEGPYLHLRLAVWASGGLRRVQEGPRNRIGAAAKLDQLPMNGGGPEQGQW